jgi:hypothetical protein
MTGARENRSNRPSFTAEGNSMSVISAVDQPIGLRIGRWALVGILGGAAVIGASTLSAGASIPNPNGVIRGCYSSAKDHKLQVVDSGGACPAGTTELDWNIAGTAGPGGPDGSAGPAGPAGVTGTKGPFWADQSASFYNGGDVTVEPGYSVISSSCQNVPPFGVTQVVSAGFSSPSADLQVVDNGGGGFGIVNSGPPTTAEVMVNCAPQL